MEGVLNYWDDFHNEGPLDYDDAVSAYMSECGLEDFDALGEVYNDDGWIWLHEPFWEAMASLGVYDTTTPLVDLDRTKFGWGMYAALHDMLRSHLLLFRGPDVTVPMVFMFCIRPAIIEMLEARPGRA